MLLFVKWFFKIYILVSQLVAKKRHAVKTCPFKCCISFVLYVG
nr:MAG TPA: hypothetical protein [Caudoviricetes sp.]